jgi:Zn-dependent protease with chaperone function
MSPPVALLLSGAVLGVAAPVVLARLPRLDRAPQLAAWLWPTAAVGTLSALMLAGLLLLVGSSRLAIDLAELLATCSMALRRALDAPTGEPGPLLGLLLLTVVVLGLLGGGAAGGFRTWRTTREHRRLLALAGRSRPDLPGVTVLDHPVPLAYCLPGRPGPVVLTTATLERLDAGQLAAVLTHERAHQARRHHALLLAAAILRIGFPWLPATRAAQAAVTRLVELAADDAATRRHGPAEVASAIAKLAAAPAPTLGLSAAGANPSERIRRLTTPASPGLRGALLLASLVVLGPVLAQLVAVSAPLLRVAGTPICPLA